MFGWFKRKHTVENVMEAYGELLVKYPSAMLDVSMLPIPKAKMKILLKGLYAQAKTAEQQRILENGFFLLSNFQDGVGPVPISGELPKDDIMENFKEHQAILDKWIPWQKLAVAELDILATEWSRFKVGEPI